MVEIERSFPVKFLLLLCLVLKLFAGLCSLSLN